MKNTLFNLNHLMFENQSNHKDQLLRLVKIVCSVLNELACSNNSEGAYFISRDEYGGSCQCIQVLIVKFEKSRQGSMEHSIGKFTQQFQISCNF